MKKRKNSAAVFLEWHYSYNNSLNYNYFHSYVRCKLRYKNTAKEASLMADITFNDERFDHLCKKDDIGFWKDWRKWLCTHNLKPWCIKWSVRRW